MRIFSLCFTGISGSGKSTIAKELKKELKKQDRQIQVIDGDILRQELGQLFGYTKEERFKNSHVVRVLSRYLNQNSISTIVAIVAPYEQMRQEFRDFLGEAYLEVYIKCSYEECARRDVKGYYKKQKEGIMENLNGADAPFEVPEHSDIVVDTEKESIEESVNKIMDFLKKHDYVI